VKLISLSSAEPSPKVLQYQLKDTASGAPLRTLVERQNPRYQMRFCDVFGASKATTRRYAFAVQPAESIAITSGLP
jgi:hypothetical protein